MHRSTRGLSLGFCMMPNQTAAYNTVPHGGLARATALANANGFTCALLSTGTVQCWGDNSTFQLGNNIPSDAKTPVACLAQTSETFARIAQQTRPDIVHGHYLQMAPALWQVARAAGIKAP